MISFLARRKKRRKVPEVHLLNNVNHRKLITSRRKSLNKTGRLSSLFLLKEREGAPPQHQEEGRLAPGLHLPHQGQEGPQQGLHFQHQGQEGHHQGPHLLQQEHQLPHQGHSHQETEGLLWLLGKSPIFHFKGLCRISSLRFFTEKSSCQSLF